ncbi:MAG TPA: class I SAM-dependent methyltransferase [Candidatus Dormibacteraeota bacterium]|nr:class I SAM-dependent methyltransferase [Candidatus Dormibacteraeota bacterium]
MNYRDQEKFLRGSRIWGGAVAIAFLLVSAILRLAAAGRWHSNQTIVFFLAAIAVAVLMYYTPDYLHLSVAPEKKRRWEISLRWRIIAAIMLLGLLLASSNSGRLFAVFGGALLAGLNWIALKKIPARKLGVFFWSTDLVLLFLSLVRADAGTAAIILLVLAAAVHMAIVRREDRHLRWTWITFLSGMVVVSFATGPMGRSAFLAGSLLLVVAIAGTAWLVHRAREQNAKNIASAMAELIEFTGYPADRIQELWATSNQQLAANWQTAKPAEDKPEQMAEWYRQNSELYLFAISAYNLEYKRIRSNMKVMRLARGATLDYGAGNGEILLELARRGHRAAYYDVEGVTMRFARQRAAQQGLSIDFFHSKDALAQYARENGFDTVFSFDVLEHLPDLAGELTFLSSLLNPGGVFVFDVPAGSTKAHPMHLNHSLNVLQYMSGKGLVDERNLMLRLPFRKEEKFVFRAVPVAQPR